jgi:hypothetical protein
LKTSAACAPDARGRFERGVRLARLQQQHGERAPRGRKVRAQRNRATQRRLGLPGFRARRERRAEKEPRIGRCGLVRHDLAQHRLRLRAAPGAREAERTLESGRRSALARIHAHRRSHRVFLDRESFEG